MHKRLPPVWPRVVLLSGWILFDVVRIVAPLSIGIYFGWLPNFKTVETWYEPLSFAFVYTWISCFVLNQINKAFVKARVRAVIIHPWDRPHNEMLEWLYLSPLILSIAYVVSLFLHRHDAMLFGGLAVAATLAVAVVESTVQRKLLEMKLDGQEHEK